MTRDICHAAKHGNLTWDAEKAASHDPLVAKLEYQATATKDGQQRACIWVVTSDQSRHSVVDVLQQAISDWTRFLDQKGV